MFHLNVQDNVLAYMTCDTDKLNKIK